MKENIRLTLLFIFLPIYMICYEIPKEWIKKPMPMYQRVFELITYPFFYALLTFLACVAFQIDTIINFIINALKGVFKWVNSKKLKNI